MEQAEMDAILEPLSHRAATYDADPARWLRSAVQNFLRDRPEPLPDPPLQNRPLFVYGALKPDELAFQQIAAFVSTHSPAAASGHALRSRDGLPLLVNAPHHHVKGALLNFVDCRAGYDAVRRFEPRKHYKWAPVGVSVGVSEGAMTANALVARSEDKGAEQEHVESWSCADDPVFTEGVPVAAALAAPWLEVDKSGEGVPWQQLFHLQAAYLLVWTAVERVSALRFGPATPPGERLHALAGLRDFPRWFQEADVRAGLRRVVDSRDPNDHEDLRSDGSNAWKYWYQVRSNMSHRGKGAHRDVDIVAKALVDVHDLLRLLLLDLVPGLRRAWTRTDPEGEHRQWRLRPRL